MKPSMPSTLLCMLLSCLLASCASDPQPEKPPAITQQTQPPAVITGRLLIYPDTYKNPVHPGESVVFEFIPTVSGIHIGGVRIDTGESGKEVLGCGPPCKGKTVRTTHKYDKEGSYNVVVRYQGVPVAEKKIIIVEQYTTDKELQYQVITKVARELKKGMKQVAERNSTESAPKFAFSSLKNANFDYEENQLDVEVI